jgi:hypothetical protein
MSRKKRENGGMQTNDATETTPKPTRTRTPRDPNAPPVKRPRSGSWLPVVRTYQIPGTDISIDVEMYTVEFAGETCEVRKNREGVKRGNAWIKGIKARGEEALRVDRIRRQLEEMSEAASTQEMTARLYRASRVLAGDEVVFPIADQTETDQSAGPTVENHPWADATESADREPNA